MNCHRSPAWHYLKLMSGRGRTTRSACASARLGLPARGCDSILQPTQLARPSHVHVSHADRWGPARRTIARQADKIHESRRLPVVAGAPQRAPQAQLSSARAANLEIFYKRPSRRSLAAPINFAPTHFHRSARTMLVRIEAQTRSSDTIGGGGEFKTSAAFSPRAGGFKNPISSRLSRSRGAGGFTFLSSARGGTTRRGAGLTSMIDHW